MGLRLKQQKYVNINMGWMYRRPNRREEENGWKGMNALEIVGGVRG